MEQSVTSDKSTTTNRISQNSQNVNTFDKKEDLSQVNPQLYEWLATINDKSSNNSIYENSEKINTFLKMRQVTVPCLLTNIEDITNGAAGQALIKAAGSADISFNMSISENGEKINSFDKKEEAPTNYGVARPVGNALQNASSNDSVYQNYKKINSFEKKAASKKQYWANIHFDILLKNRDKRQGRYGPSKRRTDTPATCL